VGINCVRSLVRFLTFNSSVTIKCSGHLLLAAKKDDQNSQMLTMAAKKDDQNSQTLTKAAKKDEQNSQMLTNILSKIGDRAHPHTNMKRQRILPNVRKHSKHIQKLESPWSGM